MDNRQDDHQASLIEMDGKLCDQVIYILIDPGSNYSYINPNLVDKCGLRKKVHAESCLVQSAIGAKKRVHHWVRARTFELSVVPTRTHLNVLPLGLYSMLLVHISSDKGKDVEDAEIFKWYPVLQQYKDMFLAKIPELPPHREVDFSIELVLGATPSSKAPYKMSTPKLVELKL
eukprot:PITA_19218